MKIALVYDVIYPYVKGGVEKRVWELGVRLASRGHEVHLFGMKYWDGDDIQKKEGVILHGVCPSYPLYSDGRRKIPDALIFSIRIFPALVREKFDIIDCQQFPYFSCITARAAAAIRHTPLVITWHEVWGEYWYTYLGWKGCFGKLTERVVALLTQNNVAVSETTAQNGKSLGIPVATIIQNGIDLSRMDSIPPSPEDSDLIFVGRLIREKHADILVDAMAILIRDHPDLRLLIVGDGPEWDVLRQQVRVQGLKRTIRMAGFFNNHDDVLAAMKSSRVFVLPSTREGFGIAALEALACGLPVVTVDHPENAICDLVTEKTGFLSSLSPDSLAACIKKALVSGIIIRPACIAASKSFDWDAVAVRAEQYYMTVIKGYRDE
ncbi:glycosyltransferase family 4 protein [Methanoregula sp.]|uniref:glycosyltransferase family 4 protein n=1 Tax=Methanoregula sp. TaxID=2052170 RepID=UPI002375882D|nr:glycosyltransferase family 4 protein [Methanoregula sp.]MDD1687133.1 glycosyltransferase family 4 protein [Methanoregula sp.]